MKMHNFLMAIILVLLAMNNVVISQNYTDWTGFEYLPGRYDSKGRIEFYELQKDYTISLPDYFLDANKLPPGTEQHVDFYNSWARALPPCDWDFISIEFGGILTVKKGYRWDGSSYPCKDYDPDNAFFCVDEHFNLRSSLVHDALYDLMRMEYLAADHHHNIPIGDLCVDTHVLWDAGDHNRRMADMLLYMIAKEDGQPAGYDLHEAESDYLSLRELGACKSHDPDKLESWKYHVSELTAYASDGKVELQWKRPDEAGKCPDFSGYFSPMTGYSIQRNGIEIASVSALQIDFPNPPLWNKTYTDSTVVNGMVYGYRILPQANNYNQDDWSNEDIVVPMKGPGNTLLLDGIDDYIEANTVSNDYNFELMPNPLKSITLEAWVYPEVQTGNAAILAFNTISGGNHNILFYNGNSQKFNYYDPENEYTYSDSLFSAEQWYHVAVTINIMNEGILYINGVMQATFNTGVRPSRGAKFSIGQEWDNTATSQHFKGMIDEVRIWKTVRSQEEILATMTIPLIGNEVKLIALWHFDEPSETNLSQKTHDATVHSNDGFLHGYALSDRPFTLSGAMNNTQINKPPVAADDSVDTEEDNSIDILVLANDLDIDGVLDSSSVSITSGPIYGEITGINLIDGIITYVPGENYHGEDTLLYTVRDDSGASSNTAMIRIIVNSVNDPPVFMDLPDTLNFINTSDMIITMNEYGMDYDLPDDSLSWQFGTNNKSLIYRFDTVSTELTLSAQGFHGFANLYCELSDIALAKVVDSIVVQISQDPMILDDLMSNIPKVYSLEKNYPNPFNPVTHIKFGMPTPGNVEITVYDILGQKVKTLWKGFKPAGYHILAFDAGQLASGLYFYQMQSEKFTQVRKMVVLK